MRVSLKDTRSTWKSGNFSISIKSIQIFNMDSNPRQSLHYNKW